MSMQFPSIFFYNVNFNTVVVTSKIEFVAFAFKKAVFQKLLYNEILK